MNIDLIYQNILNEVQKGHRGLQRFNEEDFNLLHGSMEAALSVRDETQLEKTLCLLDHSATHQSRFEDLLIRMLNSDLSDSLIVFTLNATRKHIMQARFQRGERLHYEFLESLKRLLYSSSPEVVEWTLRTIEECGNQGVYFLREFDNIKPAPWKWFNAHQRAVSELITLLERRWRRFEQKP